MITTRCRFKDQETYIFMQVADNYIVYISIYLYLASCFLFMLQIFLHNTLLVLYAIHSLFYSILYVLFLHGTMLDLICVSCFSLWNLLMAFSLFYRHGSYRQEREGNCMQQRFPAGINTFCIVPLGRPHCA